MTSTSRPAAKDYRRALTLLPADHPGRADLLVNAGTAIAQQIGGDARAHAREAKALLEDVLGGIDEASSPDLAALVRTNLAQVLMLVARDDDAESLRRARDLCDEALTYRSPERNVEDWAYSMVNRGAALERLAALGEATRAEAEAAYRAVVNHAHEPSSEVAGHAKFNLLALLMADVDQGDDEAPPDDATLSALIERAIDVAHNAAIPPVTRGRAMLRLARLQHRRGATDEAVAAWSAALPLLTGADLRGVRDAGWELGATLAALGRWNEAAAAYRAGLEATESLVTAPRDVADRAQHTAAVNRLRRWAAHAFVACGSLEEAVVTLENGRTRELRRQLQLEDPQLAELERFVPHAVADWRTAAAQLAAQGADLDVAGAALDDALARIRAVPGFERFGLGAELRTVQAAATEGFPSSTSTPRRRGRRCCASTPPAASTPGRSRSPARTSCSECSSASPPTTTSASRSPTRLPPRARPRTSKVSEIGPTSRRPSTCSCPGSASRSPHRSTTCSPAIAMWAQCSSRSAPSPRCPSPRRRSTATAPCWTGTRSRRRRRRLRTRPPGAAQPPWTTLSPRSSPSPTRPTISTSRASRSTSCPSTSTRRVSVPAPRAQGRGCRSMRRRRRPSTSRATASEG